MKNITKKIKYIKLSDFLSPIYFFIALVPSIIIKYFLKKEIWLICEDGKTARDNGLYFFKYMIDNHPEIDTYYVIDKKSADYNKLLSYGEKIIQFKSINHWILYMASKWNISNHKHGNPCQSFWCLMHVFLNFYNNRIFLQHGIIKDDLPFVYYKNSKFKMFICSVEREYKFVCEKFGYPLNYVQCTGLPRFDNLINTKSDKNTILIMPTWRSWFGGNDFNEKRFKESSYFKNWHWVLNDDDLMNFIKKNNITIYFYQHQHMQKYSHLFISKSENLKIVNNNEYDIQELLIKSSLLITDYSSVFMDFAFMNKPVLYFHFDYNEFRSNHLSEGYFSYKDDGFGKIVESPKKLIKEIKELIESSYLDDEKYMNRRKKFFTFRDNLNSQRIYIAIKERENKL